MVPGNCLRLSLGWGTCGSLDSFTGKLDDLAAREYQAAQEVASFQQIFFGTRSTKRNRNHGRRAKFLAHSLNIFATNRKSKRKSDTEAGITGDGSERMRKAFPYIF